MNTSYPVPRFLMVAAGGLSSRLIEWFGAGGWSHWANLLVDGWVVDARDNWVQYQGSTVLTRPDGHSMMPGEWIPPGVQFRPISYLEKVPRWARFEIGEGTHYGMWRDKLVSQIGKPYDSIGIWDFLEGSVRDRNWRDQRAWFCDELGVWALEGAGVVPRVPEPVYRITPGAAMLFACGAGARLVASQGLRA